MTRNQHEYTDMLYADMKATVRPDYVARLRAEIGRREQMQRYYDAAEGEQWFSETLPRQDNEQSLANAHGRLEAALKDTP